MAYKDWYKEAEEQQPGKGQGVGEPKQGQGGFEYCVCSKCGYEIKHERNEPCNSIKCPKCDIPLTGKN